MLKIKALLIIALFLPFCVAADASTAAGDKVTFLTDDGVIIVGVFSAPRGNKATLVLLHGLGSTKEEWQRLEARLAKEGYGYLAYDARGHGESTVTKDGAAVTYRSFGRPGPGSPWEKMTGDLACAVQFLECRKTAVKGPIYLMGASLGANVCLIYAAGNPRLPVVVALSAGMNYAGIEPADSIVSLASRRVLFAVSPGDTYAFESTTALFRQLSRARGKTDLMYGDEGHGVQMFNERFENRLLRWLSGT